jgi:hypothetical protein
MYWYTDREKEGIFYSGHDAEQVYDSYWRFHVNPKSSKYGAVLCSTKRIVTGFELKMKFFFRSHWYWKPEFRWRYGIHYFHWLFFMVWLDKCYTTKIDKVIKNHLSTSQNDRTK